MDEQNTLKPTPERKILLIERDDQYFTPLELIPEDFNDTVIRFARQYFKQDNECDMFCQNIKVRDFSIWHHEVLAKKNILLIPYSPRHILALHFNQADAVVANIYGRGNFDMVGRQICLFNLPEQMHTVPVIPGGQISSFHINIIPGCMGALVREFPELKGLLTKKVTDQAEPLNQRDCTTNVAIQLLLDVIKSCRLIEDQAECLLRRCCVSIFANYLCQDATPENIRRPVDDTALLKVFDYLQNNVHLECPLRHTAFVFNLPAVVLAAAFENMFYISLEDFAFQQKMLKAYHHLVYKDITMAEIARKIGLPDEKAFLIAFTNYFHCDPVYIRHAQ
ncbi:helix-turn-helix transcriptional regulator [Chitinophaga qingshengii]|uniref:Helix-turn-helix transcriptional regulator n=1 Tax=Chitinophaga qingshengii TaxID=1569794 RepID=A0ABR7TJ79_9BACT|nr:helix-turn-helix transcriptional regulator [Chitinophaga qingshengii]MBC9929547.1 helix-turn-helix transcriptional regulator [Chitinophaga qingshengii]